MLTVILTGGASRRMGSDKAMLPLDGEAMALRLAKKYECLGRVAFSVNRAGRFPLGKYVELVDKYPNCGPLNGIVSAFSDTAEDTVFLTATDMPDGNITVVTRMISQLGEHDACMFPGEPLFGIYRRSCFSAAVESLKAGEYSIRNCLKKLDVVYLQAEECDIPSNLNTQTDYEAFIKRHEKT